MAAGERYEGLIGTQLLAVTPDDPEVPGAWTRVERDVLSVVMEEDDAGLLAPLFTTPEALARWRPTGGCFVERDAVWHFRVAASDPAGRVVIDPGSDSAVVLDPLEVAALAAGAAPGASPAAGSGGGQVLVATPIEGLSAPVAEAVREVLAEEAAVRSARLFVIDQGCGLQPVVLVDLDPTLASDAVDALMGRVIAGIDTRTDDAGGLTFLLVTEEWRPTYGTGGIGLFAR